MSSAGQERLPLSQSPPSYGTGASPPLMARKGLLVRVVDSSLVVLVPWVIFTLVTCIFTFALEDYTPVVWSMAAACALVGVLFITLGMATAAPAHAAVGFLTWISVVIGALVGILLLREYMDDYALLDSGATYRDLDPAEAASSHADATQLYFRKGSFIDRQRSVGYMRSGDVFCVAPIIGPETSSTVEYWAVGKNCCEPRGHFMCSLADKASALNGLTVTTGLDQYRNAARMAQSVYQLVPPSGVGAPIFVERTVDIPGRMKSLWWKVVRLVLVASGVHLAFSCFAGFLVARLLK